MGRKRKKEGRKEKRKEGRKKKREEDKKSQLVHSNVYFC